MKSSPRAWYTLLAAALVACAAVVVAESVLADVIEVPVDRVVTNLERLIAAARKDPELHLNLARAHVMAYALKSGTIKVTRGAEAQGPAIEWMRENEQPSVTATTDRARLRDAEVHLRKALVRYEETIALAPSNGLARLGYAWALQQSGAKERAIEAYRETIKVSWPQDRSRQVTLMGWQSVTDEAARYLIPLLDRVKDKIEIANLRGYVDQLAKLQRAITPVAIPLRDDLRATEVVDPSARVLFDLDGTGLRKPWTWITPDAAWLVMDRHGRKNIRSGLQLFGNVTFWLFWENGYHAMRALDDDGDGRLRGAELVGLALWRDRNRNGVSEADEVRPLASWRIVELSCDYRYDPLHPDEIAFSPEGVRFADGHTRPTFDLVLHQRTSNPITQ